MPASLTLKLVDGVQIVVPDSLNLLTPYVLTEQQDWFEDEIKFLRKALLAGDKVIDIGSNFGTYSLSMAQSVGPSGHVWAFEPASTTAGFLARSIAANGFSHVTLEQCALSNAPGIAQLALNDNSEMNALVRVGQIGPATESVKLETLDGCSARHGWSEIAFVKLDAEGEETNIVMGGKEFFARCSPLVQYEVTAGSGFDFSVLRAFAKLGYRSYRLVRGIGTLVPFDESATHDDYLLNLFCCKPDRAATLGDRGLLLDNELHLRMAGKRRSQAIGAAIRAQDSAYPWQRSLATLAFARDFASGWAEGSRAHNPSVEQALAYYALSRDLKRPFVERFDSLEVGYTLLKGVCERQPTLGRLATFARVASDFGVRASLVKALQQALVLLQQGIVLDAREPFLPPVARFDSIAAGKTANDWFLAAMLEAFELNCAYSSFYTGHSARGRLEALRDLGVTHPEFAGPEMARRLELLDRRAAKIAPP